MFKKFLPMVLLVLSVSCLHAQTVAYVPNQFDNSVSVIDTSTNTVTATISLADGANTVAFSPDGTHAYVLGGSLLQVIDTGSQSVVATVPLTVGFAQPGFVSVSPDNKSIYVPSGVPFNVVSVVNAATNTVVATISLDDIACSLVFTPDGAHAYVVDRSNDLYVVDTHTNTVLQELVLPGHQPLIARTIAITPDGSDVYVLGNVAPSVDVIATATNTNFKTISLPGSRFLGITITPDGSRAYISNTNQNLVNIVDTATNTVEAVQIPVGAFPQTLAVTPDGAFVYTANGGDNTVSVIDTATNTVVATVPVGIGPIDIAIANLSAPFAAFTIDNLVINSNLHEQGDFTLGANTGGIDLAHQPLTLTVNNFSLTIPAGGFKQVGGNMHFVFNGTVNGLKVNFNIQAEHGSSTQFDFVFDVHGVSIGGPNPATVGLKIGHNSGTTTAAF